MFISVEISSYNRWETLRLVLDGLTKQTHPLDQFEVVISDDASSDGTFEKAHAYAARAPFAMTLIRNHHAGPGATHNTGIRCARADIVLMIADDILPTPQLLTEHARMHMLHPEASVAVVGRLEQSPQLPQTPLQRTWDGYVNALFPRNRMELDYRDFWVNNLSFKKAFMLRHGMFREWPPASHEDLELGYRLQRNGMRLLFCHEALAYHHHPETIDSISRRSYAQGYNWHFFESEVLEAWVRARSGRFSAGDSMGTRARFWTRRLVQLMFFNCVTVPLLLVPLIRRSARTTWLGSLIPLFLGRVAGYYFRIGVRDRGRGAATRLPKLAGHARSDEA